MPTGVSQLGLERAHRGPLGRQLDRARRDRRSGGRGHRRPSSSLRASSARQPWPGAGVISSMLEAKGDLDVAPEPAEAGGWRGRSRRSRPSASLRAGCRRCRAARRSRGRGAAASSCERRRRLEVPTRAPSARSSSEPASPMKASVGSSRAGHADERQPLGQLAREVLGRVHAEVDLAGEQRLARPRARSAPCRRRRRRRYAPRPSRRRRARRRRSRPGRAPGRCPWSRA